jgi:hypothetical protein
MSRKPSIVGQTGKRQRVSSAFVSQSGTVVNLKKHGAARKSGKKKLRYGG